MVCTDRKAIEASQVAYLELLKRAQSSLKADGRKGPFTIRELINESFNTDVARKLAIEAGIPKDKITLKDLVKYSDLTDSDKAIIAKFSPEIFEWKILDIHDTRIENGFYACCIEISEENAIVAFRGSESMRNIFSLINDWIRADLALLNSRKTWQQEEAEKYADKIIRREILEKYKGITVVGHSLGGNLATHFTTSCATDERKMLFSKIEKSFNLDGPGVSQEYIEEHAQKIEKAAPKLTHLKWSAVGDLLSDIPGEDSEYLAINEQLYKDDPIARIKYKTITRHRTTSLIFDGNGKAIRGRQDTVSKRFSILSKLMDKLIPEWLTTELYVAADWVFEQILNIKKKIDGIDIKFGTASWSERIAKQGGLLATCANFINSAIDVFKEVVLGLGELFAGDYTINIINPKVAFADVCGGMEVDPRYNSTIIGNSMRIFDDYERKGNIGDRTL